MRRAEEIDNFIWTLYKLGLARSTDMSQRYRLRRMFEAMQEERIRMSGEAAKTIERWTYNGD